MPSQPPIGPMVLNGAYQELLVRLLALLDHALLKRLCPGDVPQLLHVAVPVVVVALDRQQEELVHLDVRAALLAKSEYINAEQTR